MVRLLRDQKLTLPLFLVDFNCIFNQYISNFPGFKASFYLISIELVESFQNIVPEAGFNLNSVVDREGSLA
jgi:hypothetical protein